MNSRYVILSLASLCAVIVAAPPAGATVAGCQIVQQTVADPFTHITSSQFITSCGPVTDTISNPVPIATKVLVSVAPPDSQFFEFSPTTTSLIIDFLAQSGGPGTLSLYKSLDDSLLGSNPFTDGFGTLSVSNLVAGNNYILNVDWITAVDPPFDVFFNAAINAPAAPASVSEPATAPLLGAGLFAMGWASRRRRAAVASR